MRSVSRRLVATGLLLALAGCGFHPMYGGRAGGAMSAQLDQVSVDLIPERAGQLLRQALQQHLEGSGEGRAKQYGLSVAYSVTSDALLIQRDSTATRVRMVGSATWTLRGLQPGQGILRSGTARMVDGLDIIDQQYFAADLESEDALRRLAESVADQITLQMASYFNAKAS